MVRNLVESGRVDPDSRFGLLGEFYVPHETVQSWTALHAASREGHVSIVEYLLQKGADPNALDSQGNPPMYMALCALAPGAPPDSPHALAALALLRHKAAIVDVTGDRMRSTFLHHAAVTNARVVEALLKAGADPNRYDSIGFAAPLHLAASWGDSALDCAKALVEGGADVNAVNSQGRRPLDFARPHSEMARFLRSAGGVPGDERQ
jgi:ankyrin repeat protein